MAAPEFEEGSLDAAYDSAWETEALRPYKKEKTSAEKATEARRLHEKIEAQKAITEIHEKDKAKLLQDPVVREIFELDMGLRLPEEREKVEEFSGFDKW